VNSFEVLRDEWNHLPDARGIFATCEWSEIWWRHYGGGKALQLHTVRAGDGRLVAVLPLYVSRARWPRVIRFLGHGPGDELGPVHARGDEERVTRGLCDVLDSLRWNLFLGEQLPGDEGWSARLRGELWRRESCPVLRVPEGRWDAYLSARSANFRQQLRRRERELELNGSVRFRLADRASLERDLDTLFALHRARWDSRRTDFSDTPFHRELAHTALERGWLRLWLLELDDAPIAAWHGFQVGTTATYYQAGRDPTHERFSAGFVLLAHSIRSAIAEGAAEYRFGRGAEPFKFRFTQDDPHLETTTIARGPLGRVALASLHAARFTRRRVRRGDHRPLGS
jgi:CelD/BcsL family acetyltransferase involved in cellulose biosynthesis